MSRVINVRQGQVDRLTSIILHDSDNEVIAKGEVLHDVVKKILGSWGIPQMFTLRIAEYPNGNLFGVDLDVLVANAVMESAEIFHDVKRIAFATKDKPIV